MFENPTGSLVTFEYLIMSNRNEKITGRTALNPGKHRMAGWLFLGDQIIDVSLTPVAPSPLIQK
jgi:hypothetical protein